MRVDRVSLKSHCLIDVCISIAFPSRAFPRSPALPPSFIKEFAERNCSDPIWSERAECHLKLSWITVPVAYCGSLLHVSLGVRTGHHRDSSLSPSLFLFLFLFLLLFVDYISRRTCFFEFRRRLTLTFERRKDSARSRLIRYSGTDISMEEFNGHNLAFVRRPCRGCHKSSSSPRCY